MTTPDTLTVRVNAHQFASAIRYVALAAAKDDGRPVLAGINLRIAGTMLDIAAADGFRLHVAYVQLPSFNTNLPAPDAPRNVLIDAQALLTWAKTVKTPKKAGSTYAPTYATLTVEPIAPYGVRVCLNGGELLRDDKLAKAGGLPMPSAWIDGTFPDYRQIIPATDEAHRFRFNAEYLRDAAKPYLRGKRDEKKLGTPRTILYTAPDGFPHVGAAGFEMPDNTVGNGETTSFAHVARFGPGTAASILTLATVLNTNYLTDALAGVDHGATFQTAATNTAVRLDLWQTQYAYSTQLTAVIMPMVLEGLGHPGISASAHRDLNAPDAAESPVSDETAGKDAAPMPAPEHATILAQTCDICHAQAKTRTTTIDGTPTAECGKCRLARKAAAAERRTDAMVAIMTKSPATTDDDDQHPVCGSCGCGPCACEQPPAEDAPAAQCPVCGAALETGDRFCPMCGYQLSLEADVQKATARRERMADAQARTERIEAHTATREHRCERCVKLDRKGWDCEPCNALNRTLERRAARAATLAAQVAPEPEPADVLPYSGAQDLSAKYSQGNVLRILAACPTATDTRGFHQWQEAGRAVKKGEKGILIYTPAGTRTDKDGNERTMVRKAYVWDVSQTEPIKAFRARQDAKKASKDAPVLCADCGNPDADGLCSACAYVRKATTPAVATPYPSVQHMNPHVDRTPIRPAATIAQPAMRAADI